VAGRRCAGPVLNVGKFRADGTADVNCGSNRSLSWSSHEKRRDANYALRFIYAGRLFDTPGKMLDADRRGGLVRETPPIKPVGTQLAGPDRLVETKSWIKLREPAAFEWQRRVRILERYF